jgi:hypothetical protein
MTKRFESAFQALYNGLRDDKIIKGSCVACAVGNIVAHAMNGNIVIKIAPAGYRAIECLSSDGRSIRNDFWSILFMTDTMGEQKKFYLEYDSNRLQMYEAKLFDITGYNVEQMARIEHAFETETWYPEPENKEDILNSLRAGIIACLDVMIDIDKIENGEIRKQEMLQLFKKKMDDIEK